MPEFPIANGFYQDEVRPISSQQCVNLIPQFPQAESLSAGQLRSPAGIDELLQGTSRASRGQHVVKGVPFYVSGNALYRIEITGDLEDLDGTAVSLGFISGSGNVSMADNGTQLCIVVPGSTAYIYTDAGGLVIISDSDFVTTLGPSEQVVFIDTYFVHFNNNSAASTRPIFFISNINDGTAYDPLDFGTAEADPDNISGLHVTRNQLYVCGEETIEPFSNVGGVGFPFQSIRGGVVPKGVKAKFSLVEYDDSFVFIGGGRNELPSVWKFTGSSGQKISTASIDNLIQNLTDSQQKNIHTSVYGEGGGFFLNIHLPDRTLTFDSLATVLSGGPKWHERKSRNKFGEEINWRADGFMVAFGGVLVTDNQDGRIGVLNKNITTDYGDNPNRSFSLMPFSAESKRFVVRRIELTCESGVGVLNQPEPKVTAYYSDDGGYKFGNGTDKGLGLEGEYKKRQIWRRQGQAKRFRVYRFDFSGPGRVTVIKLDAEFVL